MLIQHTNENFKANQTVSSSTGENWPKLKFKAGNAEYTVLIKTETGPIK